jgi:ribosome assembly protein YihI (activator of Der GTPase)
MSSWFDLDLSAIQEQISNSITEASKVLEEVSKSEILNLDVLAEREEEEEKYEEMVKGMNTQDIESLLALQARPAELPPTRQQHFTDDSVTVDVDEEFDNNEEETGHAVNPETSHLKPSDLDPEDGWDEFDYPSTATASAVKPARRQGDSAELQEPEFEIDSEDAAIHSGFTGEVADESGGTMHHRNLLVGDASSVSDGGTESSVPSGFEREPTVVDSTGFSVNVGEDGETKQFVHAEIKQLEKNNQKRPPFKVSHTSKSVVEAALSQDKKQKKPGMLSISQTQSSATYAQEVTSTQSQIASVDPQILSAAPIPADVLERILKKREKKLKKKGLWPLSSADSSAADDSTADASKTENVTMTMLMSDTFGFGIDDAAVDTSTITEGSDSEITEKPSAGTTLLSSFFSSSSQAQTDSREDTINGADGISSVGDGAAQGSVVGGFVFPISFAATASTSQQFFASASKAVTDQYRSIFDDVIDHAASHTHSSGDYDDPILRQVEANKRLQQSGQSSDNVRVSSTTNASSETVASAGSQISRFVSASQTSSFTFSSWIQSAQSILSTSATRVDTLPTHIANTNSHVVSSTAESSSAASTTSSGPVWWNNFKALCVTLYAITRTALSLAYCLISGIFGVLRMVLGACVDIDSVHCCTGIPARYRQYLTTDVLTNTVVTS